MYLCCFCWIIRELSVIFPLSRHAQETDTQLLIKSSITIENNSTDTLAGIIGLRLEHNFHLAV